MIVSKPRFRVRTIMVEVRDLRLHSASNRELQQTRVKKLERTMDIDKLGRLAAWRDGHNLYVIDGQHRKVALENLGLGNLKVRVDVYENISFQDACDLFLGLNDSLSVRPFDKFDKAAKAGYQAETETKQLIEAAGLRISPQAGDGKVIAVAAAVDVWRLDQGHALKRTLSWITEAWGSNASALEGQVLRGLGLVASRYNGELDDAALVKKLAKFPGGPPALQGRGRAQREIRGGTVGRNIADIVVDVYNKGRRTGQLPPL